MQAQPHFSPKWRWGDGCVEYWGWRLEEVKRKGKLQTGEGKRRETEEKLLYRELDEC